MPLKRNVDTVKFKIGHENVLREVAISDRSGQIDSVCERLRCSKVELLTVLRDPQMQLLLEKEREALSGAIRHRLHMAADRAVSVLVELMGSNNESIKLKAATEVINQTFKLNALEAVEKRLQLLEVQCQQ